MSGGEDCRGIPRASEAWIASQDSGGTYISGLLWRGGQSATWGKFRAKAAMKGSLAFFTMLSSR